MVHPKQLDRQLAAQARGTPFHMRSTLRLGDAL
jgi:hypothetical protein